MSLALSIEVLDSDEAKYEVLKTVEEEIARLWQWIKEVIDRRSAILKSMVEKPNVLDIGPLRSLGTQTEESFLCPNYKKKSLEETSEHDVVKEEYDGTIEYLEDDMEALDETTACEAKAEHIETEDGNESGTEILKEENERDYEPDDNEISDDANFLCDFCEGLSFDSKKELLQHMLIHIGQKSTLQCDYCDERFTSDRTLNNHMRTHNHRFTLECFVCGFKVLKKRLMAKHLQFIHGLGDVSSPNSLVYTCEYCQKEFSHPGKLRRHHLINHAPKISYDCPLCDMKYDKRRDRVLHMRNAHSNDLVYNCVSCNLKYGHSSDLESHYTAQHSKTCDHVCTICGKSFLTLSKLSKHERMHSGERSLVCDVCGKTYRDLRCLQMHYKIHERTNCFSCGLCGKEYQSETGLKYHLRGHDGKLNAYFCDICGRKCKTPGVLKIHKRLHSGDRPFVCTVCGNAYTVKTGLMKHMRTHTGERPHSCPYCSHKFITRFELKTHLRKHTGEKPYCCVYCGMTFTTNAGLYKHNKKKHQVVDEHVSQQETDDVKPLFAFSNAITEDINS